MAAAAMACCPQLMLPMRTCVARYGCMPSLRERRVSPMWSELPSHPCTAHPYASLPTVFDSPRGGIFLILTLTRSSPVTLLAAASFASAAFETTSASVPWRGSCAGREEAKLAVGARRCVVTRGSILKHAHLVACCVEVDQLERHNMRVVQLLQAAH